MYRHISALGASAALAALLSVPAVACAQSTQHDTTKPPASSAQSTGSKVGKTLDKAGSDTKHEAKRTGKHIKSGLSKVGKAIGKAGHDVKAEARRDANRLKAKKDTTHTP